MAFFSIVVVSLNGEKALPMCMEALFKTEYQKYEVILVDNGSSDNTSAVVKNGWKDVKIIRSPKNLGFAGGNNLGIKASRGDWVVLLNDDTEVDPDWLNAFDKAIRKFPDAGILGCKLLYPDRKTIQHAGGYIDPNGLTHHYGYGEEDKGQHNEIRECAYVTGAAFAINRALINKIGGLDDAFFPIYFEEVDFCRRAHKAGFKTLYVPEAVVIHHESRTTTKFSPGFLYKYHKNRIRFLVKNLGLKDLIKAGSFEEKWIAKNMSSDNYLPLIKSYLTMTPKIPFIILKRILKF